MAPLRAVLLITGVLCAQAPPPFCTMRQDEEWSYLRDPAASTDWFDRFKYLPLGDDGAFLTVGGEVRERYEYFRNAAWGEGPQDDDGYLMQRFMLHGDLRASDDVRLFAQLKSAFVDDRTGGARPTDEDRADVHQAFADVSGGLAGGDTLMARLGRQELAYGSSRLVSVREGPNVRLAFEGGLLRWRHGDWLVDAFAVRPVTTDPGRWDDEADPARAFLGVYATGPWALLPGGSIDVYCLVLDRDAASFQQGTVAERRWSFGTRLSGQPLPWDYDVEAVWQAGTAGNGGIAAWTVASDIGCTLPIATTPRLGLKINVASGDRDPAVDTLQTFHALFPRGSYFGEPALIGPANLFDVHPSLQATVAPGLRAFVDCDWFWRQSTADGVYSAALTPLRPGTTSSQRFVGSQVEVGGEWALRRHVALTAVYARFFAGPWLRDTGAAEDIDYFSVWVTFKF